MMPLDLTGKKIIISTHVYATGPAQDLRDYLIRGKIKKLLFIGHPLFYSPKLNGSSFYLYENGVKTREKVGKICNFPNLIAYSMSTIKNIYFFLLNKDKWDLYVGSNNLNTFAGLILRSMGYVKKVVYYVIDYNPKRFNNVALNKIYHWTDHFCVRHADETWNLSPRMIEGRKKHFNFEGGNQKVVPLGVWFDRIKRLPLESVDKHLLIFMGHVLEKQGVQNVLEAIPEIAETIPDFKFKIIGGGVYLEKLKELSKDLGVEDRVIFTGFVDNHEDLEKMVAEGAVAIAPYNTYMDKENQELSFTYYADPAKIKVYLACGLPVLLTDLSYNAREIEREKCGIIIESNPESIAGAVIEVTRDENILQRYRRNASKFAEELDWNRILFSALAGIQNNKNDVKKK